MTDAPRGYTTQAELERAWAELMEWPKVLDALPRGVLEHIQRAFVMARAGLADRAERFGPAYTGDPCFACGRRVTEADVERARTVFHNHESFANSGPVISTEAAVRAVLEAFQRDASLAAEIEQLRVAELERGAPATRPHAVLSPEVPDADARSITDTERLDHVLGEWLNTYRDDETGEQKITGIQFDPSWFSCSLRDFIDIEIKQLRGADTERGSPAPRQEISPSVVHTPAPTEPTNEEIACALRALGWGAEASRRAAEGDPTLLYNGARLKQDRETVVTTLKAVREGSPTPAPTDASRCKRCGGLFADGEMRYAQNSFGPYHAACLSGSPTPAPTERVADAICPLGRNVSQEGPCNDERGSCELCRVVRFEVVDHRKAFADGGGRVFVANPCRVELSYQDGGRTLKVFVDADGSPTPAHRAEEAR